MNGAGMIAPHRDGHASHTAGQCTPTQQAAAMQRFDARAFANAELPQPLRFTERETIPFYPVYEGRLAKGQFVQMQLCWFQ